MQLNNYADELEIELQSILHYWSTVVVNADKNFYGEVDDCNKPDKDAPKGIVLFSRILWTFSTAELFYKDEKYLAFAKKAFNFIQQNFIDAHHGGVIWSVTSEGKPLDNKKQIYGLAFCIYGLSAYAQATKSEECLQLAKNLFFTIEEKAFDKKNGGYIEAFTCNWKEIDDLRLSNKDANEKKTMNTHLHIVEAYAALYKIWPNDLLKQKIQHLLDMFTQHILAKENDHLLLFFTETWQQKSFIQSFGHDIEASWLLHECAIIINDESRLLVFKKIAVQLADAALKAIDTDGGMWYEFDAASNHWIKEKHWWPQAEAMVGYFNAFEITGNEKYLHYSIACWQFARKYLKDPEGEEWFWGVDENNSFIKKGKAGFWKCPYHNGRACIEIIGRIKKHQKK